MNIQGLKKKIEFIEIIKWIGIVSLLCLSCIASYFFYDYNFYIKKMMVFFCLAVAIGIFLITKIGKLLIIFLKESSIELRKVVWPTYQDSLNTTLIVVVVTVIVSLVLWGLDTVLLHVISFGLRL
ncbi:preprotein translocase, SecE subunit [Candidatus Blochmanniella vafra str. BVAF]|uniref:Protein translocase subunit SecE n=1 Tax=Blochmanniella vafra (strain BVAF) TaxID=859654 RepID=E8Q6H4_BLOVB|nr:preprotein translocase subunit SecE [Candidatus Blochmannia vafer]ADV33943.1 preprotein translocase, SecE subunit [Candidatus Blochmannia vafer str. BVAF]